MTIKELKASGLLELYVIGALNGEELATVQKLIDDNRASLEEDLFAIGNALEYYAQQHAIAPSATVKADLLATIGETGGETNATSKVVTLPNVRTEMSFWQRYAPLAAAAMLVISLGLIYLLRSTNAKNQALQKELAEVKLSEGILKNELANISNKYASLVNFNNDIIVVSATEKYPATSIYFHHNPVDKKNYIQLQNLPEIDNTKQSFQLWSIKGDNAPTPLDVFQKDGTAIVEVKHVEETNVYAITIENKGGATTPNLADLIGTFAIKG